MPYLVIYVLGVGLGLAVMRDPWPARVATALAWPLGPIAFVVVVTLLVAVSTVLWPIPILALAALIAAIVWLA